MVKMETKLTSYAIPTYLLSFLSTLPEVYYPTMRLEFDGIGMRRSGCVPVEILVAGQMG